MEQKMPREHIPIHLRKGIRISARTRELYEQRDKHMDDDPDSRCLPPEKWEHAMTREEFFAESKKNSDET
jgi:hypothetical protein